VAEVLLRRTRADLVAPVYRRFLERWPRLQDFLEAPWAEVEEILRPLGLRWRVENLRHLRQALPGVLQDPAYPRLLELPGVGDYVASAVRCFAFGEARPLIDANTVRVLGRYFGVPVGPESRRRKWLIELAWSVLPKEDVDLYNCAILDLAAQICLPRQPRCAACPLREQCCYARTRGASLAAEARAATGEKPAPG
jgi:A/G-specific adenine glycosylase